MDLRDIIENNSLINIYFNDKNLFNEIFNHALIMDDSIEKEIFKLNEEDINE